MFLTLLPQTKRDEMASKMMNDVLLSHFLKTRQQTLNEETLANLFSR